jgi:hypothetical protein
MPANRMSKFEVFIGTWNTTGEVLETEAGPAGTLSATDTYRWLPGRHFIVHDVDASPGRPSGSMAASTPGSIASVGCGSSREGRRAGSLGSGSNWFARRTTDPKQHGKEDG